MGGSSTKHDIPSHMYKTSSQPTLRAPLSTNSTRQIQQQQVQRTPVIRSVNTNHNSEATERNHSLQSTKQTSPITFKAPEVFKNRDDFLTNWFEWKCQFLTYIKGVDRTGKDVNTWGILLLNRMGPVGQEIWKSFVFTNNEDKDGIDTLIRMFDKYCAFYNVTKKDSQSIDEYVTILKEIADTRNIKDRENVIKEKILKEVDHDVIKQQLHAALPFSDCTLDALPLQQLITVWKMCEQSKVSTAAPDNAFHSSVTNHSIISKETCPPRIYKINCRWCGLRHVPAKCECPAMNSRCARCNRIGHFRIKCDS